MRYAFLLLLGSALQQDDPAPVSAPIDSWYAMERASGQAWEHFGYAREVLTPVGGKAWAFEYRFESMVFLPKGQDELQRGRLYVDALLSDAFTLKRLDASAQLAGDTVSQSRALELRGDGVRNTLVIDTLERKPAPRIKLHLTPDDPATPVPALLIYAAWRAKLLPGNAEMRYVDMWSEKPLLSVELSAGKPERREVVGRAATVIDVQLKGARDFIPGVPALSRVTIDRFGRALSAESADGRVRMRLVAGEKEATGGERMLTEYARRDPFQKPLEKVKPGQDVVIEAAPVVLARPDLNPVAAMERLVEDLRSHVANRDDASARAVYEHIIALYRAYLERVPGHERQLLEKARADAEVLHPGVARLVRQARALVETIETYGRAGDFARVEARLGTLRELARRPEFWKRKEQLEVDALLAEGERLADLARSQAALLAKKLVLTGCAVTSDPKTTFCVINDHALRVGETIEGVRVDEIRRETVVVALGAARRELTLSK
jgi:hypothetical protein